MNTATDTHNVLRTRAIADALATARETIRNLEQQGITVFAVSATGRQPTLFVDRMPEGVASVIKRHSPTAAGREVIRAAPFQGCQLETMREEMDNRVNHAFALARGAVIADRVVSEIFAPRLQAVPRD
ncbi:hypothetical protein [Thermomonas sp.]|uniref:hypothetical protein n=1 Tax=Thermomonas sp. TaxID=1971895 RepID=UPI0035AE5101